MTITPARFALCNAACLVCLCVAGCANTGMVDPSPDGPGSAHTPAGQSLAPKAAMDMIAIGKTAKVDVSAALGRAIVIPFESGYEVWIYRWAGADKTTRAATELVVLFEPSGLVTKARVRPGYATPN
jgi:hypothetical protein